MLAFLNSFALSPVSFDHLNFTYYRGNEIEENHYYPFGLCLQTASLDPALKNNIKYNSKELQHDEFYDASGNLFGLQWEDYGARMQDPQIGRWNGIDAKAEKYSSVSPYAYCANNPITFIDPNGNELRLGGNTEKALGDIRSLVPSKSGIEYVGGKVVFTGYDKLSEQEKKYEGVKLLGQMVNSEKNYKYSVGDKTIAINRDTNELSEVNIAVETYDPPREPNPQNAVANYSITHRQDNYPDDHTANFLPEPGFDGSVTIRDGEFAVMGSIPGDTKHWPQKRNTIVFHELDENLERTEGNGGKGLGYKRAHKLSESRGNNFSKEINHEADGSPGFSNFFTPSNTQK